MLVIKLGCIEGLCVLAATISKLTYFAVKYGICMVYVAV